MPPDWNALIMASDGPIVVLPDSAALDALGFGPVQDFQFQPPVQEQAMQPAKLTKQVLEAIVFMAELIEDRGRDRCEHPDWFRACVEAGAWAQQQLRLKATAKQRRQERRAQKAAEALRPRGRQIVFAPEGER